MSCFTLGKNFTAPFCEAQTMHRNGVFWECEGARVSRSLGAREIARLHCDRDIWLRMAEQNDRLAEELERAA
jgi:hypothetical protein